MITSLHADKAKNSDTRNHDRILNYFNNIFPQNPSLNCYNIIHLLLCMVFN